MRKNSGICRYAVMLTSEVSSFTILQAEGTKDFN